MAASIAPNTEDVRAAIKREIWTRELTYLDVADRMGMDLHYIERVLSKHGAQAKGFQRIHPPLLDRIIEVVGITPRVARRLHLLAARDAGWKV